MTVLNFHSYKITSFDFKIIKNFNLICADFPIENSEWKFRFNFSRPVSKKGSNFYIAGMSANSELVVMEEEGAKTIATLTVSIDGVFSFGENDTELTESKKSEMLTTHANAILFPHLRAAVSQNLAVAGVGNVVFPLVNVMLFAKENLKKILTINYLEERKSDNQPTN